MNSKEREKALKHSSNAKRLAAEGFNFISFDGNLASIKFDKALYELNAMSDVLQRLMAEIEETQYNNEFSEMEKEKSTYNTSASGSVEIIGSGLGDAPAWLHLRLEMLLPSSKNHTEVKRLSNTVTNPLDLQSEYAGCVPQYERAFVVVIEHTSPEIVQSYDHDNKGFRAIPNALKGRLFGDDNQFTMSYAMFSVHDENDPHCDIYIIPVEDIVDFAMHYLKF
jgi:hypothetical protein